MGLLEPMSWSDPRAAARWLVRRWYSRPSAVDRVHVDRVHVSYSTSHYSLASIKACCLDWRQLWSGAWHTSHAWPEMDGVWTERRLIAQFGPIQRRFQSASNLQLHWVGESALQLPTKGTLLSLWSRWPSLPEKVRQVCWYITYDILNDITYDTTVYCTWYHLWYHSIHLYWLGLTYDIIYDVIMSWYHKWYHSYDIIVMISYHSYDIIS